MSIVLIVEELKECSRALSEANYVPDVEQITAIALYHGDGDKVVLSPDDPWCLALLPQLSATLATYREELMHRAHHGPEALALEVIANLGPDNTRTLTPLDDLWVVSDAAGKPVEVNGEIVAYADPRLAALVARSGLVRKLSDAVQVSDGT